MPLFHSIPTSVGGIEYRSRLEARWAMVFTMLGLQFQYEVGKFEVGRDSRYIPDFWLPTQDCWIEIKPGHPSPDEVDKARRLAIVTQRRTFIFGCGVPEIRRDGSPFYYDCTQPSYEHGYKYEPNTEPSTGWMFGVKECCGKLAICWNANTDQIPCECLGDAGYDEGYLITLQRAFTRGRMARWD